MLPRVTLVNKGWEPLLYHIWNVASTLFTG